MSIERNFEDHGRPISDIEVAALALVKAKIVAKGNPVPNTSADRGWRYWCHNEDDAFLYPRGWTVKETELHEALHAAGLV